MRFVDRVADYAVAVTTSINSLLPRRVQHVLAPATGVPVVLVPGVWENSRYLTGLADWLRGQGHTVHVVPGLGWNIGSIGRGARIVAAELDRLGLDRVLLVAHSKGGLIGKQVMLDPQQGGRVLGLVAVATPFAGSRYANWMLPGTGLRNLRPQNAAIVALAGQLEVNSRIVLVHPRIDPHVPDGFSLPGAADEIEIDTTGHFRVLDDPRARRAILGGLRLLADQARQQ